MIKVRLLHPGQPDIEFSVAGNSAVIGRDADCDIPVQHPYVSKRHVQILRGFVLIDLGSSNGTFVKGEKVVKPRLLEDGLFNLAERLDVAVEVSEETETRASSGESNLASPSVDELALMRERFESERARAAVLGNELNELRRRDQSREGDERLVALKRENQDLRHRLDSLKEEIENREVEAAASVQARLANEQLRDIERKNQELAARVRELEAQVRSSQTESRTSPSSNTEEVQRLRAELAQARQGALPPSELFAQLHRENQELRSRLQAFESGQASSSIPASELFLQLQSENRDLRRRIQELETAPPSKARAESSAAQQAPAAQPQREPQATGKKAKAPRVEAAVSLGGALGIARLVVERDIERVEASTASTAEEFLMLEALRFLRGTERLVTRAAGEMIQLYDLRTMLPEMGGNFRSLTGAILEDPNDHETRGELTHYLEQLSRWLVVSVGAHRKAALEFAVGLKKELSEEALTEKRPMPALRIVAGQREAELWRRVCEHLRELSPELIEDRIEKLSRVTARGLLGSSEGTT